MSDLPALQAAIDAAAAKVIELKKSGGAVELIKAAVAELLAAKTAYAAANDGKLADGTPFDPNASKKDKKKKKNDDGDKAANAAANAPTADSLAKKAAKKAEKAAKKAAAKAAASGGAPPPPAAAATAGAKGKPAPAAPAPAAAAAPPRAPPASKGKKKGKAIQFGKVEPLQLIFSPNAGAKVPFVTLLAATMTGLDPDFKLKMDR
ncbi:hypothetical protein TrRE_jg3483 [Triparma retinervis]|uniref:Uncharacterized protein n=1 Tax=Triparma retinervis TaxID=2557542 RepID=A0A9W6ZZX6_9STRA|nr:hypothetical protein TrRE_jg3483 [Triparma retinervis]